MPSLKAIRRRITSVKSTQKITKAMKLVAAARLRRAQQAITELRPYAKKTVEVLSSVASRETTGGSEEEQNELLVPRQPRVVALVVFSGDRGLAGAFNTNVNRITDRRLEELRGEGVEQVVLVTIGRKGRDYQKRRGTEVMHDFTGAYQGGAKRAQEIAHQLMDDFLTKKVDRVEIVYTEFKSAISQRTVCEQVLPVQPAAATPPADTNTRGGEIVPTVDAPAGNAAGVVAGDFLYEPDRRALLDRLLPMYVEVMVFRGMLESQASFFGSQMTAMDNASKNAKDMIGSLTLQYNRARQAAITKELMEIIGGAEALKG